MRIQLKCICAVIVACTLIAGVPAFAEGGVNVTPIPPGDMDVMPLPGVGGGSNGLTGACCFLDGSCLDLDDQSCISSNGLPHPPGSDCSTAGCSVSSHGACGPGAGDCFSSNGTPGCDDVDCCNLTCFIDPFCCDVNWDEKCAGLATALCGIGTSGPDCNSNGIPDDDDIRDCPTNGTGGVDPACDDCNSNGIPDGCEPDCNSNGVPDECDIFDPGNALQFDGVDDYVNVVIDVSESAYTASLWFRTTCQDCGIYSVVKNPLGGGGHDRHIYLTGGNIGVRISSNETIVTSGTDYADGQWHQVVHVFGASIAGQRIYVDGTMKASGVKSSSNFSSQLGVNIGHSRDGSSDFFAGEIDEVRVWDVALSPQEIMAGYVSVFVPRSADLTARWSFDEAGGVQTVFDDSGLGNDGSLGETLTSGPDDPTRITSTMTAGSRDCNSNGVPDECDIASGTSLDCNINGVPDGCDLAGGTSLDCNTNGVPDKCDIAPETSQDCDFGLEALYRTGEAAPGGGVFDDFNGSANVNASGTVAFYGELVDGREGIWRGGDLIARSGDLLPDGLVCTYLYWSPSITNSGVVGFKAYSDGTHYEGVYSDTALLDYKGRDLGGGGTLDELWVPWINNSGSAIYYGYTDLNDNLILRDQTVLLQEGDPAPGGGTYTGDFWRPVHNDAGQIAYGAAIDGDNAICTPSEVLARVGQPTPIGGTWNHLTMGAEIDSTGLVAWRGHVDTGSGIVDGLFTKDGAIVKEGDLAPNGMVYTEFKHMPSSNANGDWIFPAQVYDAGGGQYLWGIFTMDQVVILAGDLDPDGHEFVRGYRADLTDEGWFGFYGKTSDDEAIYRGFIPDECDTAGGTSEDCNTNGIPDECELEENDCNSNGVPDDCDIRDCPTNGSGGVDPACDDCNSNGRPDECDIANGTSPDSDSNGIPDECELSLDIKPGSCPNPLNRNSNGVLPVGLLGTADFDVAQVDVSSITISRADGVGGAVAPNEGPPGPHTVTDDVGRPFDGELCGCHDATTDGIDDLMMHFRTQDVVDALGLDGLSPGDTVELVVRGVMSNGLHFQAFDCILIVPPGNNNLTVTSNLAGVFVEVSPLDIYVDGAGFATFQRNYPIGALVYLTAPDQIESGKPFRRWSIDGVLQPPGNTTVHLTLMEDATARALYRLGNIKQATMLADGESVPDGQEAGSRSQPASEASAGGGGACGAFNGLGLIALPLCLMGWMVKRGRGGRRS